MTEQSYKKMGTLANPGFPYERYKEPFRHAARIANESGLPR